MRYHVLLVLGLVGCAATPEQMAQQSNWDVCRFTMGGPHSAVADAERRSRGLDCSPLYPAIAAKIQAENAAMSNYLRSIQPPPPPRSVHCNSYRIGNSVQTDCR
jgi:hypothetical protein